MIIKKKPWTEVPLKVRLFWGTVQIQGFFLCKMNIGLFTWLLEMK